MITLKLPKPDTVLHVPTQVAEFIPKTHDNV